MEPSSQVIGASCDESGWTSYIASHIHESNSYSIDKKEGYRRSNGGDSDTDDSMISDASSGPIHSVTSRSKASSHGAKEKQRKQASMPRTEERREVEMVESVYKPKSASSRVQSAGKVKKAM